MKKGRKSMINGSVRFQQHKRSPDKIGYKTYDDQPIKANDKLAERKEGVRNASSGGRPCQNQSLGRTMWDNVVYCEDVSRRHESWDVGGYKVGCKKGNLGEGRGAIVRCLLEILEMNLRVGVKPNRQAGRTNVFVVHRWLCAESQTRANDITKEN
ncbi:uncharacterized protein SPSK_00619 [Sporothrix schenckii 1099-18]|uniref:Uncharacterized protein n=1 Tax=Sporothrix schenckii 1099-18 TaxID=1397361 RepID=A0A0F2LT08_SPOSC|nr:uncharacterized protein SPSK_00619 [Sporothrix schenckii 1099-18]KJR79989.1 hypothetical protein SPSK_00619 [Sporothrix schenckii 1099-18]